MPHPEILSGKRGYAEDVASLAQRSTYTLELTATTTDPDVGTLGTIDATFYATGSLVTVWFSIRFDDGADPGSGNYRFSVPSDYPIDPLYLDTSSPLLGNVRLRDASAPNETVWVPFAGIDEGANDISVRNPDSPNSQEVADDTPWVWATGDRIRGMFTYLAAET